MEKARTRVMRWPCHVEEPQSRQRIYGALSPTEPEVVVDVDENATHPRAQHAAAGPPVQQRHTRRGEHNMISNSHHALLQLLRSADLRGVGAARSTTPLFAQFLSTGRWSH